MAFNDFVLDSVSDTSVEVHYKLRDKYISSPTWQSIVRKVPTHRKVVRKVRANAQETPVSTNFVMSVHRNESRTRASHLKLLSALLQISLVANVDFEKPFQHLGKRQDTYNMMVLTKFDTVQLDFFESLAFVDLLEDHVSRVTAVLGCFDVLAYDAHVGESFGKHFLGCKECRCLTEING